MSNEQIHNALATLKKAMAEDPGYAWAWHCNIAMPIVDTIGVSGEQANEAAAFLMFHLFDCDMTSHPFYEGQKPNAQAYAEMRIAADREEDAALAEQSQ